MPYVRWLTLWLLGLAVSLPSQAETIYLTGRPASVEFLRSVLQAAGWTDFPGEPLAPGQSWTGPHGDRVVNLDWRPGPYRLAALSDHPEEVDRRGLLFPGGLTAHRPIRFQYYHLSALTGDRPELALWVSNPGPRAARLHLSRGIGVPSRDYFSTGHTNNVAWFTAEQRAEGVFLEIPPGETRKVFRQPFLQHDVVSGTLGLTQVEGPPLDFGLVALQDPDEPLSLNNLLKASDVHSRGFYPIATQGMRRRHEKGQGETRVTLGGLRQETFAGVRELRGDYGVVSDLELELVNPGPQSATFQLLFNPRGGAATATFLIDNDLVEVERTAAFEERAIATLTVAAASSRRVRLQTIPEGASSYPVRLLIRG